MVGVIMTWRDCLLASTYQLTCKSQFFTTKPATAAPHLRPDRLLDLMDLVADDYVEGVDDLYKLTTKGQNLLADRAVGVNQS
jgi:hypothetical protein